MSLFALSRISEVKNKGARAFLIHADEQMRKRARQRHVERGKALREAKEAEVAEVAAPAPAAKAPRKKRRYSMKPAAVAARKRRRAAKKRQDG
jgi:hypothetical protein